MKRTKIQIEKDSFPDVFLPILDGADIYDSSCSREARVYFIDRDNGYYLKAAPCKTLAREAQLDAYFHSKGLGAHVIDYISDDMDYLLTERVAGEDCTYAKYLEEPNKLCDLIATTLRALHEIDASDCPINDRVGEYIALVEKNYRTGNYDSAPFPDSFGYRSAEDAIAVFESGKKELKNEVLIHGDYCLPNIMLDDWRFSGFIDLGNGGVGDRHIDLFWGAWTLFFNLKTDRYRERFFDAYGRDMVDTQKIALIAACEVFG